MEYILQDLITHIADAMPDISLVDEDYGQLEMLDQQDRDTYPLTYPAVLIDAPEASWTNDTGNNQRGTATIRARLIIDCYDDTHAGSGSTGKIAGREEMRQRLHSLLQGHRIQDDQALNRTASRFYTWNHGIKVYEQTYTVMITERLEEPTQPTTARPQVTVVRLRGAVK